MSPTKVVTSGGHQNFRVRRSDTRHSSEVDPSVDVSAPAFDVLRFSQGDADPWAGIRPGL
jgi:hypothetical protein